MKHDRSPSATWSAPDSRLASPAQVAALGRTPPWALPPWWPPAATALVVLALVALDLWWLWEFRRGYPLNIDEAAYLAFAFDNVAALKSGGMSGLWKEVQGQAVQAPLVPLLTLPINLVFGERIFPSFLVSEAFFALLVFASYGVGRRLAGNALGALTAVAVATMPGVTEFTRQYHFAVPSAAFFTAATYALLRSDGLRRWPWVVAWGALLGLTVLARTVMLALVPALIAAAALLVAADPEARSRRAAHLGLGLLVAVALAATWYARNLPSVLGYLTNYGYGAGSELYGSAWSATSLDFWTARAFRVIDRGFYLPLSVLLLVALAAGAVGIARRLPGPGGLRGAVSSARRRDALVLVVVLASGYLALTSSRNTGTGFELPLLPLVAALGTASLARLGWRPLKAFLVAALLLVAGMNAAMNADIIPALSTPQHVRVSGLGTFPVLDGRGSLRRYLEAAGYELGPPTARIPEPHRGWLRLDREVAAFVLDFAASRGRRPIVFFASQDPLYSTNSVRFASRAFLHTTIHPGQFRAKTDGDNIDAYRVQLDDPAFGRPNFVVATDRGKGEFRPYVTQAYVESAAQLAGFRPVKTFRLPDGRETRIWWLDRGPSLPESQRVAAGFLKLTALSVVLGPPAGDGRTGASGVLTDGAGAPLSDAPVEVTARPLDGLGDVVAYTRGGGVPTAATQATIGLRVNTECDCSGPTDSPYTRAATPRPMVIAGCPMAPLSGGWRTGVFEATGRPGSNPATAAPALCCA